MKRGSHLDYNDFAAFNPNLALKIKKKEKLKAD
jgi:hypothetical protein